MIPAYADSQTLILCHAPHKQVDAALDELNQARVAELLRQLARGSGSSGCQVLAVTHNAAFQAFGQTVQVAATPS